MRRTVGSTSISTSPWAAASTARTAALIIVACMTPNRQAGAMSPGFIRGIADSLTKAAATFDKFHAVKIINDAVDQVRSAERKAHTLLAGSRFLWLRNPDKLSEHQRAILEDLPMRLLKTARLGASGWLSRTSISNPPPRPERPISSGGTSGQLTAACRRSSTPFIPSDATGMPSCAGSAARPPMACSRASTASSRPLKPKRAITAQFETLPP